MESNAQDSSAFDEPVAMAAYSDSPGASSKSHHLKNNETEVHAPAHLPRIWDTPNNLSKKWSKTKFQKRESVSWTPFLLLFFL